MFKNVVTLEEEFNDVLEVIQIKKNSGFFRYDKLSGFCFLISLSFVWKKRGFISPWSKCLLLLK